MFERGKHMLSEEYFPAERRGQFIFHGKKVLNLLVISTTTNVILLSQVVIECQKRDDYQEAIRWFLDHFKQYTSKTYHDLDQAGEQYIRQASGVFVFLFFIITDFKL